MSKYIVDDHLFTPEEVAYLESRNRYFEIEVNAKEFGPGGPREHEVSASQQVDDAEDDVIELDRDIYEYVVGLDVAKTKAALRKANISPAGEEHELKALLAQHLQEKRDADR